VRKLEAAEFAKSNLKCRINVAGHR
jgi:hypothetical protein